MSHPPSRPVHSALIAVEPDVSVPLREDVNLALWVGGERAGQGPPPAIRGLAGQHGALSQVGQGATGRRGHPAEPRRSRPLRLGAATPRERGAAVPRSSACPRTEQPPPPLPPSSSPSVSMGPPTLYTAYCFLIFSIKAMVFGTLALGSLAADSQKFVNS